MPFAQTSEAFLIQDGYEVANESWRTISGKAAASQGTGVRDDLRIYIKYASSRSFQAWGFGDPYDDFGLMQVYRVMYVSEYSQEDADRIRDEFKEDEKRIAHLAGIGRRFN